MTHPTDDSPQRDPRFDAAWRAASSEEPTAALDAAILAAAHREVGAKAQTLSAQAATRARRHWWPLAAAAAIAVIAIGIVQRTAHDDLVAPPSGSTVVTDMPATSPTSGGAAQEGARKTPAPPSAPRHAAPSARGGADAGHAERDSLETQTSPASSGETRADAESNAAAAALQKKAEPAVNASAPSEPKSEATAKSTQPEPFPAARQQAGAPPVATIAPESAELQRNEGAASIPPPPPAPAPPDVEPKSPSPAGVPMAAPPAFAANPRGPAGYGARPSIVARAASGGPSEEARMKDRAPLPVPDWIALIRRLRDEGNAAEAARELAAFRTAHADHEKLLPSDLRDWRPPEK